MSKEQHVTFKAKVLKPKNPVPDCKAFVVLPKEASAELPRRGRTSVVVMVERHEFQVTLEPDGNLSHWIKLSDNDLASGNMGFGEEYTFSLSPVAVEPEPIVPDDLAKAIQQSTEAFETWQNTTALARVDWVHWVESAKQTKTRVKRIADACNMLAEGKRRVCCFDNSGFYSKALKSPKM